MIPLVDGMFDLEVGHKYMFEISHNDKAAVKPLYLNAIFDGFDGDRIYVTFADDSTHFPHGPLKIKRVVTN